MKATGIANRESSIVKRELTEPCNQQPATNL